MLNPVTKITSSLLFRLSLFILSFSIANSAFAGTYYPDFEDEAILTLNFRCAKPTECRKLTQKDFLSDVIFKTDKDTTYTDINHQTHVSTSEGYYVGSADYFFPVSAVGATNDGNYYICDNGSNIVLEDSSIELTQDLFAEHKDSLLGVGFCPTFWAPKHELIPSRPDLIQTTDYFNPNSPNPFTPVTSGPGGSTYNPFKPVPPIYCYGCGGGNPNPPVNPPEPHIPSVDVPAFPLYYLFRAMGLTKE